MKKILIIGCKGMLGQELLNAFKDDYEVIGWDREQLNIADAKQIEVEIGKLKPDAIINAAAYNQVDKCENPAKAGLPSDGGAWKKEFELAKKINGLAPGYLAKVAKKIGAVLVHYSTDYVFDGEPGIPEPEGCAGSCFSCSLHEGANLEIGFKEDGKPNPISNYGKSKLMGEKEVAKNYGKKGKYYIIRLSKLFGKQGATEGAKRSFFDVMLDLGKKAVQEKTTMRLVDEEISCFTYAPDLARKTKEIIESKKPYGIYHVTNAETATWYEAARYLFKVAKIKPNVVPITGSEYPRPAKRPYNSTLINTKLNPLRSYKLALKEFLEKK